MGKTLRLEDRGNQAPQPGTEVKIAVDLSRSKWVYCVRWEGAERLRLSTGSELKHLQALVRRYQGCRVHLTYEACGFGYRLLDKLFSVDRRTLMTRIIVHVVKEFGIEMARIHNDSTSITFCGEYRDQAPSSDGHNAPRITHGHNKDHRPDLKQLLWTLSISADGGIPVHYNVDDGNMSDDLTHRRTWDILRQITGSAHFIYTADCKLCSRANMAHIVERGGLFITVFPKSRKEDPEFRRSLAQHPVAWKPIGERGQGRPRHPCSGSLENRGRSGCRELRSYSSTAPRHPSSGCPKAPGARQYAMCG